jgi:hypothetical protein
MPDDGWVKKYGPGFNTVCHRSSIGLCKDAARQIIAKKEASRLLERLNRVLYVAQHRKQLAGIGSVHDESPPSARPECGHPNSDSQRRFELEAIEESLGDLQLVHVRRSPGDTAGKS